MVNYHPFGRWLHGWLYRSEVFGLLREGTWTQGGCWALAEALHQCSPKDWQVATVWAGGVAQHCVAATSLAGGTAYADGDGLAWWPELVTKLAILEGLPAKALEVRLGGPPVDSGIPGPEVAPALAEVLWAAISSREADRPA